MTNEETIVEETEAVAPSAMEELLASGDVNALSRVISGVLEFLTVRATVDGPYYILADDGVAVTVIAANDDVQRVVDALPEHVKSWADLEADVEDEFLTDTDPGDEQADDTE